MQETPLNKLDEKLYLKEAVKLHQSGKLAEARDLYKIILSQNPMHAQSIYRLGTIALQTNQFEKAAEYIRQAIRIGPATESMYINQGTALRNLEKYGAAIKAYDRALKLNPLSTHAFFNKARTLQAMEKFKESLKNYFEVINLDEKDAEAWVNIGSVQKAMGNNHLALQSFEKAGHINPSIGAVYSNIGAILFEEGLSETAFTLFEKAIKLEPENVEYIFKTSNFFLASGELEKGWRNYDKRFVYSIHSKSCIKPEPPPYWNGENLIDLKDKKILLWTEAGMGEEILCSSIIPELLDYEIDFTLECTKRLVPVLSKSFPSIEIYSWEEHTELVKRKSPNFDLQYPLMSMLKYFRPTFESIKHNGPFIIPDLKLQKKIRAKYLERAQGRRIVGISWKSSSVVLGNDKTIALQEWKPILSKEDVLFVSVQYGENNKDIASVKKKIGIDIFNDTEITTSNDLMPVLAQIAAMDLVISVSNTNVHFAGSMGIPVWSMLNNSKGLLWFWFVHGERSPWYSSVRLFRQTALPEFGKPWWPEVVEETADALSDWLGKPLKPNALLK